MKEPEPEQLEEGRDLVELNFLGAFLIPLKLKYLTVRRSSYKSRSNNSGKGRKHTRYGTIPSKRPHAWLKDEKNR